MLAVLAPLLAGCGEPIQAVASTSASEPDVSIIIVKPHPQAVVRELPGRIAPTRVAEVRSARVRHHCRTPVPSGQRGQSRRSALPDRSAAVRSRGTIQRSGVGAGQGHLDQAIAARAPRRSLTSQRAAPEAENEKAIAAERQAAADVEGRKADVARAKLNLDYATIRAPIDGVVGAAQVSEGALVVQNDTATLATIQQLDPIYADFTQSVSELNHLRRAFETGELERIAPDAIKVRLVLDDGSLYPLPGKLLFSEAKVDANTGQVTLRGEFPNPKRELLPGMYVRVLIEQGIDCDAIAVPQQAVQRNGGGGSEVFVVKDDNRVAVQPVRTGSVRTANGS